MWKWHEQKKLKIWLKDISLSTNEFVQYEYTLYSTYIYIYILGMRDIIGLISESADNGFKCKYRYRPDMKN